MNPILENERSSRGPRRHAFISALLALSFLALLPLQARAAATGALENPTGGSFQSGIGIFSGWVCDADEVTLTVDGTEVLTAAYGTDRGDTAGICGDSDNGFGLLWNFALFGDGTHTVEAAADGMVFGSATFTVTTLGAAFTPGLEGFYNIPDFPISGSNATLGWLTGNQNMLVVPDGTTEIPAAVASDVETSRAATGALENPGAFASGIMVFSGWVCEADVVTLTINGTDVLTAAYGTERGDTAGICGDSNNGFGLLWNANLFGDGTHTVEAAADGMVFATRTFTVTGFGVPFVSGAPAGTYRLPGFPTGSTDISVAWSQAGQNFFITSFDPTLGPTPTPGGSPGGGTPTPTPTPTGSSSTGPTPSPPGGLLCGNGIVDDFEECDWGVVATCASEVGSCPCSPTSATHGALEPLLQCLNANASNVDCDDLAFCVIEGAAADNDCDDYGGSEDCTQLQGIGLTCNNDCTLNGSDCLCICSEDFECEYPFPGGLELDIIGVNCTDLFCDPSDTTCQDDRECIIEGVCEGGACRTDTTPNLGLCTGLDSDGEFYCLTCEDDPSFCNGL